MSCAAALGFAGRLCVFLRFAEQRATAQVPTFDRILSIQTVCFYMVLAMQSARGNAFLCIANCQVGVSLQPIYFHFLGAWLDVASCAVSPQEGLESAIHSNMCTICSSYSCSPPQCCTVQLCQGDRSAAQRCATVCQQLAL